MRRQLMRHAMCWGWLLSLSVTAFGCVTPIERADRAYEKENWVEALNKYDEAFKEEGRGDVSPEAYERAARAATRAGNFSMAERYYNRAIQNGGGSDTARELAEFYLKTAKYQKAARILQRLLHSNLPKQPIYNNLGTALMYGGAPINAESYLLIAQQMEPKDPFPYVNLGLLYDRHLNHPALAVGFYRCFARMAPKANEARAVKNRIEEIWSTLASERPAVDISCGEPYQPQQASSTRVLRERFGLASGDQSEDDQSSQTSRSVGGTDGGKVYDLSTLQPVTGEESSPVADGDKDKDDGKVETSPSEAERDNESSGKQSQSASEALRRARKAYNEEDFRAVLDAMDDVEMEAMDADAMGMYGVALGEMGRNQKAVQWLDWAVARKPTPRRVGMLVTVYRRLKQTDKVKSLCDEYLEKDGYREALSNCPDVENRGSEILKEKKNGAEEPADAGE